MPQKLTFVTGNANKAKYLSEYFHLPVEHVKLDLPEIQSLDLKEIVEHKAQEAYKAVQSPVMVEDVSVVFKGWKVLPGPFIKWFLQTLGNEGLCKIVDSLETREAVAAIAYAICDKDGVHIFEGSRNGTIAPVPRGTTQFGWDPIFIPEGHTKTWAEMTPDEKHLTSMRKIALEKVSEFLAKN